MFTITNFFARNGTTAKPQIKIEARNFRIPLIGEMAPSFTAESTAGTINFPSDFGSDWKIILSHPMDFTPVCSTELIELANLQDEFDKLGVKIMTVSTDPLETHQQWKKTLERIEYKEYPMHKINFPIVDDSDLTISKLYGMIHLESDNNRDVRGVFIIDPDNKVRAEFFYPQEVGRNMNELLRTVVALQTADSNDVMTPANWNMGHDVLVPFPLKANMSVMNKDSGEYYQVAWFLIFKKWISKSEKFKNHTSLPH
jgi:peroxiredoxin (alkyl hydroperoxide reductase subunit C)